MLSFCFMGTPPFAAEILEQLAEKKGPPVHVFTQPPREAGRGRKLQPTAVQELCEKKGWAFSAVQSVNTDEALSVLTSKSPSLVLVAAFGQILKKPILEFPKYCLNVHASLLPKYRGAAPVQRSILAGDLETGVTIQRMARKLDTGDILLQKKIDIAKHQTSGQLLDRLATLGAAALIEAVEKIEAGQEHFTPQIESEATHAAKLDKKESPLAFHLSATELERRVYGLQPWPIAETRLGKDRLQIYGATALDSKKNLSAGQVDTDHQSYLHVGCGTGVLALTEVQLENRKRLSIVDFLRGYRGNFPFKNL